MGSPARIPSVFIGGRTFTDLSNLIQLVGHITSGSRSGMFKTNDVSQSAFDASGGIFEVHALMLIGGDASVRENIRVGYGDNSLPLNTGTAITNEVRVGGVNMGQMLWTPGDAAGGSFNVAIPLRFDVPDGKFPFFATGDGSAGTAQSVFMWGFQR